MKAFVRSSPAHAFQYTVWPLRQRDDGVPVARFGRRKGQRRHRGEADGGQPQGEERMQTIE